MREATAAPGSKRTGSARRPGRNLSLRAAPAAGAPADEFRQCAAECGTEDLPEQHKSEKTTERGLALFVWRVVADPGERQRHDGGGADSRGEAQPRERMQGRREGADERSHRSDQ